MTIKLYKWEMKELADESKLTRYIPWGMCPFQSRGMDKGYRSVRGKFSKNRHCDTICQEWFPKTPKGECPGRCSMPIYEKKEITSIVKEKLREQGIKI